MKSSTPITRGGWEATGTSADRRSDLGRSPGKRAAKARQNLLDAARAAFDQHGYADTTVEHIVNRAGVARGSFYTYFESKTDIFRHLCSAIDRQVATDVVGFERSPDSDPITNLRVSTANYLALVRSHADLYRLVDQASANDPEINEARLRSRSRHVSRVAKQIRKWQTSGHADSNVDAETVAAVLVAMQSGIAQMMYTQGQEHDELSVVDVITNVWISTCGLTRRRRAGS